MKKQLIQSVKIITLALLIGLGAQYIMAAAGSGGSSQAGIWTGPAGAPPTQNKGAPINVTTQEQAKGTSPLTGVMLNIGNTSGTGLFAADNIVSFGYLASGNLSQANNSGATYPANVCADTDGKLVLCGSSGTGIKTAPVFTSTPIASAIPNQSYSYTPSATGSPNPVITLVSTLPGWLNFNGTSFSGTPAVSDENTSSTITLKATNGVSPDATQTYTLAVGSAPHGSATVTTSGSWQVPAGVFSGNVSLIGGSGGGGGGGPSGGSGTLAGGGGGGGGAGGVFDYTVTGLTPGQSFQNTIGAAGTAGLGAQAIQSWGKGGDGGNTVVITPSFTTYTAHGGAGGQAGYAGCLGGGTCANGGNGGSNATSQYVSGSAYKGTTATTASGISSGSCAYGGGGGTNAVPAGAGVSVAAQGGRGGDGSPTPGNTCPSMSSSQPGWGGKVIYSW